MQIQTVFKAGNSNVVAIPKQILEELGMGIGQKVYVGSDPITDTVFIRKVNKHKSKKSVSKKEFDKWLSSVIREDKDILDELAIR